MTDTVLSARDAPLHGPRFARNLSGHAAVMLRRLWRAYWAYQVRRAAALLRELDDGALADIGIERDEIEAWVRGVRDLGMVRSAITHRSDSASRHPRSNRSPRRDGSEP